MRKLEEVNKDIEDIDVKIKALEAQREILSNERREIVFEGCKVIGHKED